MVPPKDILDAERQFYGIASSGGVSFGSLSEFANSLSGIAQREARKRLRWAIGHKALGEAP